MIRISNRQARHLLVEANGLSSAPIGPIDLRQTIFELGFVQLDTIRAVSRAHHHILWSRNQNYREPMLWDLLKNERAVFEHFTHDASILPIELYPVWNWQFQRMAERFAKSKRWTSDPDLHASVLEKIAIEGALSTHAFDTKIKGKKEMWSRPPHKRALDYLWYLGELATSHRENFTKFYDLPERVIPPEYRAATEPEGGALAWLCAQALARLGMGLPADIQDFWGAASSKQVHGWLENNRKDHVPISVQRHDGQWQTYVGAPDVEDRLGRLKTTTSRLRILNPFDPLVRNRKRLETIFGFEYKIEIFVPAAKRKWGYYVFPILEGDRFIGRIDMKADRKASHLTVNDFWPEPDITWTAKRFSKLNAEIGRMAQFIDVETFDNVSSSHAAV